MTLKIKLVLVFLITVVLAGVLFVIFKNETNTMSSDIYIEADGSVINTDKIQQYGNLYVLTDNIYNGIVIRKNNIVIEGNGHTVQGNGNETGFYLEGVANVTIKNVNVTKFEHGFFVNSAYEIIISNNVILENGFGIRVNSSNSVWINENYLANNKESIAIFESFNDTVSHNIINATIQAYAIGLYYATNSSIVGNILTNNRYGIGLISSSNNIFRNNSLTQNECHFDIHGSGSQPLFFVNDMDTSNTVDGKPVFYWVDRHNLTVPLNAGYVILGNCSFITVKELTVKGIFLARTSNSLIESNTIKNGGGLILESSNYNNVSANLITTNFDGIYLSCSRNNNISKNNITNNLWCGVSFSASSQNNIYGNIIANNSIAGVRLSGSKNNNITENILISNKRGILLSFNSDNNQILHNTFVNNTRQASTDGRCFNNLWRKNYWSDYDGYDLDNDGIGDTPYIIDVNNEDNYPLINPP